MSTRRAWEVIKSLLGQAVSAQTVPRISRSLDEEVPIYHSRKLNDRYGCLFLDGIVLRVTGVAEVKRRVVLCSCSFTPDGIREPSTPARSSQRVRQSGRLPGQPPPVGLTGDNPELFNTD